MVAESKAVEGLDCESRHFVHSGFETRQSPSGGQMAKNEHQKKQEELARLARKAGQGHGGRQRLRITDFAKFTKRKRRKQGK